MTRAIDRAPGPGGSMVTQRQEQRRSKRYRQDLVVELHDKGGTRELLALDVARHGMFIQTDDPPRARHLVQLTIQLPSGPISAAVTVSRAIHEPKGGGPKGVGVQFFALSAEAKARWDEYIQSLADRETAHRKQPSAPVVGLPGQAPPPPPAEHANAATFVVKLKSLERLRAFYQEHVLQGGTVLFTPVLREVGEPVLLVVVHPVSDEEFVVPGTVAAVHAARPKRLEIHFGLRTPEQLAGFERYVATGKPPELPPVVEQKADRLLQRDALPWEPRALNAPLQALDLEFDVDVFAEHSIDEDDPIDWETSVDVDFSLDEHSARGAAPTTIPQASTDQPPEEDVAIEVETSSVKTLLELDTGLRPSTFLLTCDACEADPYPVEIGPMLGLYGLVADSAPRWCGTCAKVRAVPRACDALARAERKERLLARNWKAEQLQVPLTFALWIAGLHAEPACPECGDAVKETKAVDRLVDLLDSAESRTKTKIRCGACQKGWLLAAPFRIG